ncbi:DNA-binding protein [Phytoactinopolyspora mesophila]|uniref:DNA-binding protein n=1 Tax=Phytoactinopolyspora mesophila TaxID=2650750 RepID=A0A7K3LZV7_9ACTN|nr:DNA-binding protein [Phytoactinopolyspora mesophila]NDL56554.1 DNA-binding protein [Phytoactinopolyspora mesophila]
MDRKHDFTPADSADQAQFQREHDAQDRLLNLGADQLEPRPWRPDPAPPTAVDLTQYALWRSADLTPDDLLGALALLPAARAEVEGVEIGLLFAARSEGLTWAQIAEAMGFRSPQACQQYVNRLSGRQDKRT